MTRAILTSFALTAPVYVLAWYAPRVVALAVLLGLLVLILVDPFIEAAHVAAETSGRAW